METRVREVGVMGNAPTHGSGINSTGFSTLAEGSAAQDYMCICFNKSLFVCHKMWFSNYLIFKPNI